MANEFIARKGLIALSDSKVTGSLALSGDLSVVGGDIVLGTTSIFSGGNTTSLNNIDAIDATTEATIEAAIDTLANLTSIQGQTISLSGALTAEAASVINQDVTTDASPQFTAVNVGHASDTTVGRTSAGDINVEGNIVYRAGGTDVPVTDGGTGVSTLTDGGILLGSGTGAITALAVLADSEMIVGDGSGDPVAESGATLRTSIGVGTGDTVQVTGIELGHASDTTIVRASSGEITIEGNAVYRAGGTNIPVSDGGTGATALTDKAVLISQDTGTDAVGSVALTTSGQLIIGGSSGPAAGLITADDGLTVTTGDGTIELDLDLKANGGLVIESDKAAVDLGASSITGTLVVGDGGTGATSLTDGGVLLGSGTGAVTAMAVLGDGEVIVGDGTTDPVAESGATLRTSIGLGATDDVTFDSGSFTGDLIIAGDLSVQGTRTELQITELKVEDTLITVASGSADSSAANGAGLEIEMGGQTNPAMTWDHASQEFDFNYPISGSQITGSFAGDGAGLTNIVSTLNVTAEDSSTAAVALKTQGLTITGGTGIDTTATGQTVTITGEAAALDNAGVVELATTAETNTGTDATRAVTPAGLTAWTGDTALVTLGTIATGTWEGTTVAVAQGGTGATSLNNLITLTTHTTGNYVATITGGTGITSTAATSGEGTTHSLSVDAAQTQITSVGTLAAGAISSGFGAIDIGSSVLTAGASTIASVRHNSTSTTVATGDSETTSVVASVAVATYTGAQFDYTLNDGTNYRAGTVIAIWKAGTSIDFTDYSTPDIGDTSDATFTMDESGGNARLKFTSSAGTWTVKLALRAL